MKKQGPNQLLLFQHKTFFSRAINNRRSYKNYSNVAIIFYINESYFLYDKSDLIKETFITALSKKVSTYGSISYFNKKTENKIFKIISPEKFLKFYVEKDATKYSLSFQLTNTSGKLPKIKNKINYNLSLTRIEEKRKKENAWTNRSGRYLCSTKL